MIWPSLPNVSPKGRVAAKRSAGKRLFFVDIVENGQKVQALCNFRQVEGVTLQGFKSAFQQLQRGDIICILDHNNDVFYAMKLTR